MDSRNDTSAFLSSIQEQKKYLDKNVAIRVDNVSNINLELQDTKGKSLPSVHEALTKIDEKTNQAHFNQVIQFNSNRIHCICKKESENSGLKILTSFFQSYLPSTINPTVQSQVTNPDKLPLIITTNPIPHQVEFFAKSRKNRIELN